MKKQCLHDNSVLSNSVNPSSFEVSTSFAEQASSVVRRSLLLGETGSSSGTKPTHHGKKSVMTTNQERDFIQVGTLSSAEAKSSYISLKDVPNCEFCGAKKFEYEPLAFCCSNGSIHLISYQMPQELRNLYLGNTEESKQFRTYIRTYNNTFAFTSLGVTYDKNLAKRSNGVYTFKVQGQMYHFINDLVPTNQRAKNLQLYFFDSENKLQN
ncbi:uncharacterized protein LOC132614577 isoform X1 [Lycium barbarum]|uniref:uncharacterized protein LOC132614577 isoform X1 n=1 Tax=Lycium barbarum TaxID=112863 RepID=UPI00293F4699|nr:uncharacterized protein LOC132614577 isoform X1 [Lycium barbarum]XP_060185030.1 uncharacterized protein LOC132614577 isoform X1 [Lycium barbarum]